mmetsp:Transcript_36704/g.71647  ORF Transcript_36704/g.71647 Transcript_36704/m.71647 type:complete len:849 (-) Transcript_36704:106-2652(-)
MARHAALLGAACLLAMCVPASAGKLGTNFSTAFSRGLQTTLAGNANIGALVPGMVDNDIMDRLEKCPGSSPECEWLGFVVGCVAMGLIICPLMCFFICCGFCTGRRCCECCCKPCGQPNCGGSKPTRQYPFPETVGCLAVALPIFFIMLLSFSAVGFAALQEVPGDIDGVFDGMRSIIATPADMKVQIKRQTGDLKVSIRAKLAPLNDAFALADVVKADVRTLRTRMNELSNAIKELAMLIEGCKSGTTTCTYTTISTSLSNWIECSAVSESAPSNGVAMTLSDGNTTNPSCKDPDNGNNQACTCCNKCAERIINVNAVLSSLPTDAMLNSISVEIPVDDLDREIDNAIGNFDEPLDNMAESFPIKKEEVDDLQASLGDVDGIVAGINCGIWLPQWLALIAILVALALGRKDAPENQAKWGDWCWWIAYTIGVIWFIFLVCPMFGLWSIIAIPMEDICDILPVRGGTSDNLVKVITEGAPDFDTKPIVDIMDGCLLPVSGGYIWKTIGLSKQDFADMLSEFDKAAQIGEDSISGSLGVDAYMAAFTSNLADFKGFSTTDLIPSSVSSCSYTNCTSEVSSYTTDLNAKIAGINTATTRVETQVAATKRSSNNFDTELRKVMDNSKTFTNDMVDSLWAYGECALISAKYDEFVSPICIVSDNLGSFWACVLMVGCAWLAMFPIIMCASKRWHQLREGFTPETDTFDTFSPVMPPLPTNPPSENPGSKPEALNAMGQPVSADVVALMNKSAPASGGLGGLPPVSEEGSAGPEGFQAPPPRLPQYPTGDVPKRMPLPANVGSDMGDFPPPTNPAAPPRRPAVPSYPVASAAIPAASDPPRYPNLEISKVGIV